MTPQEFLSSTTFIVVLMGFAALLELALPLHHARGATGRVGANLRMTAVTLLFNWALISATAYYAARPEQTGLFASAGLPLAAQFVIGIVVMDFAYGYLAHRLMHVFPMLWRFHRIHHADAFVDVTTTYRTHPVEGVWRYGFLMVPVLVLGVPAMAVAIYRVLSVANAVFEHANFRVARRVDSWLSRLWVTPNMHKIHHSRVQAETDSNYGNILAIHDRLFGTFTPTERAFDVTYGLDDAGEAETAPATRLLALPFSVNRGAASPARAA